MSVVVVTYCVSHVILSFSSCLPFFVLEILLLLYLLTSVLTPVLLCNVMILSVDKKKLSFQNVVNIFFLFV